MCIVLTFVFLFCFIVIQTDSSENIALGKPTNQSTIVLGTSWTSDKVVDGDERNSAYLQTHNTCMHTSSNSAIKEVWWYVDLKERCRISTVRIVYREGYAKRLAGFRLFVSYDKYFIDANPVLCYKHTGSLLPPINQTVHCNAIGRYVTVYNERKTTYPSTYSNLAILELCEVFVNGCPIGKYGSGNCNSSCSIGCKHGDCYPNNGTCVQGCLRGWMDQNCDVCLTGLYGELCEKNCSFGCEGNCDRIDATCSCKQGWTGNTCEKCEDGLHGEYCKNTCSPGCENVHCEKTSGSCNPCKAGWTGSKCDVCDDGYYGRLCKQSCSAGCRHTCNKTDGTCSCKNRWMGSKCKFCEDQFYGAACEHECSLGCKNATCNQTDGMCECNERWTGNRCDVCIDGFFGASCEENCSVRCNRTPCDKETGNCECKDGWTGRKCEDRQQQQIGQTTGGSNAPTIVGSLFAVLVVITISLGLIIFIRRRHQKKEESYSEHADVQNQPGNQPFSLACLSESENETDKAADSVYENVNRVLKHIIQIDKIREQVQRKKEEDALIEEFNELFYGARYAHSVAEKEDNIQRSRYKKALPYDHSRVILQDAESDYINANYIKGVSLQKKYIATQGPKITTTGDFWQMVWQEQSSMIVMLTNIIEDGKRKCEKYWPDHLESLTFNNLEITLQDEMTYSFYRKRTFKVIHKEIQKQLLVTQMHFTTWPDHGVPDPQELLLFYRRFASLKINMRSLPIVHCSAGIGRTGTFIALDAMVEHARETDEINVFEYVTAMRQDRMNMIQTKEQYFVLHDALVEALDFADTAITKEQFYNVWTESKNDKPINQSRIRQEFQSLHSERPKYKSLNDCKTALLEENRSKNRTLDILAPDKYRIFITPRTSEGMNYINAITLTSYRNRNDIIVTQEPLKNTEEDFWVMVKEQRSNEIVCLDIELQQAQEKGLNIFTVSNCHVGELPANKTELVKVIEKVKCANDVKSGPITVICRDGATCCGLFCIVYNSIQRLQVDGDVDIYQTAKQLLARRPEFCQTFEQYQFCYDAVMEYVNTTDIYSN